MDNPNLGNTPPVLSIFLNRKGDLELCIGKDRHGLAVGRRDSGQAPGRASAHAEHAKHATRDRVVCVASGGTQRGRHARAKTQVRYRKRRGRGTRRAKRRWKRRVRLSDELSGGERLKQRWGGAKMDAKAVVLQELKSGRNSEKLANALSLLTSLS